MKRKIIMISMVSLLMVVSCAEEDFADAYADPAKISDATLDRLFSGFLFQNKDFVLPAYRNYFVVYRTTLSRYTQAVGWQNGNTQYVPGAAAIDDRWNNYYRLLAHYRELEKVYDESPADQQNLNRIFMVAAKVYLYDHTQRMVDFHGAIPFTEAGKLSQNGGDYIASLAPYDTAQDLYTLMLDDLKSLATELNSISLIAGVQQSFSTQDYVNAGDIDTWRRYCNSLRLRMLTRVSLSPDFQARAQSEIMEILSNPGTYPVVESNDQNIQIDVVSQDTPIHSRGFRTGLEDWNGNIAGKLMIDHMLDNADPRLRAMFEPGEEAGGVYAGLDPLAPSGEQETLIAGGTLSIYNRSTLSRNQYFPGLLFTASEVDLIKAEAYLRAGNDAMAMTSYENAIKNSTEFYYWVRTLSEDEIAGELVPTDDAEVMAYINSADVAWGGTMDEKIGLIATQKWIHFSVLQLPDSWAEIRRLDSPALDFWVDNANAQTLPPDRWIYPQSEQNYNTENYQAVSGNDNLTTKIFWDVN